MFLFLPALQNTLHYTSALHDILTTLFALGAALIFCEKRTEWRTFHVIAINGLFVLALMSKEMAVTLPVLLAGYSLLTKRIRTDWKVLASLLLALGLFVIVRTAVLGEVFLGGGYKDMLSYGTRTIVGLAKYLHVFVVPTPRHLNYRYVLLYASALPTLLAGLLYVRRHGWRPSFVYATIVVVGLGVSLFPVLNAFGAWYRYYPGALFALLLTYALASSDGKWARGIAAAVIMVNIGVAAYWSNCYATSSKYERALFTEIVRVPEDDLTLVAAPLYAYTEIQLPSPGEFLDSAIAFAHGRKMATYGIAPCFVDRLPRRVLLAAAAVPCRIHLSMDKGRYQGFFPHKPGETPACGAVRFSGRSKWGDPTTAAFRCATSSSPVLVVEGHAVSTTVTPIGADAAQSPQSPPHEIDGTDH